MILIQSTHGLHYSADVVNKFSYITKLFYIFINIHVKYVVTLL